MAGEVRELGEVREGERKEEESNSDMKEDRVQHAVQKYFIAAF